MVKHVFKIQDTSDIVILSSIAILRVNDRMVPNLLVMTLKDASVKARLKGYVSGVALPRIILKDFRRFPISLPPVDIQQRWSWVSESIFRQCWVLFLENRNLRQTRDLLLPKLISGEIDVEKLDIKVPAENGVEAVAAAGV